MAGTKVATTEVDPEFALKMFYSVMKWTNDVKGTRWLTSHYREWESTLRHNYYYAQELNEGLSLSGNQKVAWANFFKQKSFPDSEEMVSFLKDGWRQITPDEEKQLIERGGLKVAQNPEEDPRLWKSERRRVEELTDVTIPPGKSQRSLSGEYAHFKEAISFSHSKPIPFVELRQRCQEILDREGSLPSELLLEFLQAGIDAKEGMQLSRCQQMLNEHGCESLAKASFTHVQALGDEAASSLLKRAYVRAAALQIGGEPYLPLSRICSPQENWEQLCDALGEMGHQPKIDARKHSARWEQAADGNAHLAVYERAQGVGLKDAPLRDFSGKPVLLTDEAIRKTGFYRLPDFNPRTRGPSFFGVDEFIRIKDVRRIEKWKNEFNSLRGSCKEDDENFSLKFHKTVKNALLPIQSPDLLQKRLLLNDFFDNYLEKQNKTYDRLTPSDVDAWASEKKEDKIDSKKSELRQILSDVCQFGALLETAPGKPYLSADLFREQVQAPHSGRGRAASPNLQPSSPKGKGRAMGDKMEEKKEIDPRMAWKIFYLYNNGNGDEKGQSQEDLIRATQAEYILSCLSDKMKGNLWNAKEINSKVFLSFPMTEQRLTSYLSKMSIDEEVQEFSQRWRPSKQALGNVMPLTSPMSPVEQHQAEVSNLPMQSMNWEESYPPNAPGSPQSVFFDTDASMFSVPWSLLEQAPADEMPSISSMNFLEQHSANALNPAMQAMIGEEPPLPVGMFSTSMNSVGQYTADIWHNEAQFGNWREAHPTNPSSPASVVSDGYAASEGMFPNAPMSALPVGHENFLVDGMDQMNFINDAAFINAMNPSSPALVVSDGYVASEGISSNASMSVRPFEFESLLVHGIHQTGSMKDGIFSNLLTSAEPSNEMAVANPAANVPVLLVSTPDGNLESPKEANDPLTPVQPAVVELDDEFLHKFEKHCQDPRKKATIRNLLTSERNVVESADYYVNEILTMIETKKKKQKEGKDVKLELGNQMENSTANHLRRIFDSWDKQHASNGQFGLPMSARGRSLSSASMQNMSEQKKRGHEAVVDNGILSQNESGPERKRRNSFHLPDELSGRFVAIQARPLGYQAPAFSMAQLSDENGKMARIREMAKVKSVEGLTRLRNNFLKLEADCEEKDSDFSFRFNEFVKTCLTPANILAAERNSLQRFYDNVLRKNGKTYDDMAPDDLEKYRNERYSKKKYPDEKNPRIEAEMEKLRKTLNDVCKLGALLQTKSGKQYLQEDMFLEQPQASHTGPTRPVSPTPPSSARGASNTGWTR